MEYQTDYTNYSLRNSLLQY